MSKKGRDTAQGRQITEAFVEQVCRTVTDHGKLVEQLQTNATGIILAAVEALTETIRNNRTVYICGNGGSAADAQHIAGELIGRFTRERRALPAVALSTDCSILTAIGNDYTFDDVFARQVEALVHVGDLLWAFSTSGASRNVLKAAETAKAKGATILAFTGRPNSRLEQLADVCLCAGSDSAARSQEIHQLAYHIICDLVEQNFYQPSPEMVSGEYGVQSGISRP